MKKIAFIMSGQPRFYKEGFQSIKNNVLDVNSKYQIDFFFHIWHDNNLVGEKYDGAPWNTNQTGNYSIFMPTEIIALYNPKSCHIQNPLSKKELNVKEHDYLPEPGRSNSNPYALFSQYYSMKKANELRVEYEELSNFYYDCVIRTRFDIKYKTKINLDFFFENDSNIVWTHDQLVNHTHRAAPELFIVGNSQNMKKICGFKEQNPGLYGNMNDFWEKEKIRMAGEDYFAHLLDKENIQQNVFHFDYDLLRG